MFPDRSIDTYIYMYMVTYNLLSIPEKGFSASISFMLFSSLRHIRRNIIRKPSKGSEDSS